MSNSYRGVAQPWALSLANVGVRSMLGARCRRPFFFQPHDLDHQLILVVPKITDMRLEFAVLFRPKQFAFRLVASPEFSVKLLKEQWRRVAMAYVIATLDPRNASWDRVDVTDHNATARGPQKIVGKRNSLMIWHTPRLEIIDAQLGTRLSHIERAPEQLAA